MSAIVGAAASKAVPPIGAAPPLLSFDDIVFTNASPRRLRNPITGERTGPFAGGVPAICEIDSKRFIQIEEARTNHAIYTLSHGPSWTTDNGAVMDAQDVGSGQFASMDRWRESANGVQYYAIHIWRSASLWGAHPFSVAAYVKPVAGGNDFMGLYHERPGVGKVFDIKNGGLGIEIGTAPDFAEMHSAGDGIYWCTWSKYAGSTTGSGSLYHFDPAVGTPWTDWTGDAAKKQDVEQIQCENAKFPSSQIDNNTGGSMVRAKDQAYWPWLSVPAAVKTGRWAVKVAPSWAHGEAPAEVNWILSTNANNGFYFRKSTAKFEVYTGAANAQSPAVTFARGTLMVVIFDYDAKTVEVIGADSGDGTGPVGLAWGMAESSVKFGGTTAGVGPWNGILSEPYTP